MTNAERMKKNMDERLEKQKEKKEEEEKVQEQKEEKEVLETQPKIAVRYVEAESETQAKALMQEEKPENAYYSKVDIRI